MLGMRGKNTRLGIQSMSIIYKVTSYDAPKYLSFKLAKQYPDELPFAFLSSHVPGPEVS